MKSIIEITRLASGPAKGGIYVRLSGKDQNGRSVSAVAFGQKAEALKAELANLIPEGEDVASRRLIVEMTGEFRDGQQIVRNGVPLTRQDGSPILSRSFHIEAYKILTGPTLDLARIRRDATLRLDRAEALRKSGDHKEAYRVLLEFAARACNRPIEDLLDQADEIDEEFGDTETVEDTAPAPITRASDPEAAAAAVFAREDNRMSALREAATAAIKNPAPMNEEAKAPVEPQEDVLDDAPAVEAASVITKPAPVLASSSAPRLRPRLGARMG